MPAASGQYYLEDYIAELQAAGFDGFSAGDLKTYVNRGYFHVARKLHTYWKETTDQFIVTAGDYSVTLGTELPNFHSVDKVYLTDPSTSRRRLNPMSDDDFFTRWLPLDLTEASRRGTPSDYYIHNGELYVLSPPQVDTTFVAHYHRRPVGMVNNQDLPITPIHLDEAILLAAKIRCHKRANEPGLAALAEADLSEFFDDMADDEEMLMAEQPERVRPDNQWL